MTIVCVLHIPPLFTVPKCQSFIWTELNMKPEEFSTFSTIVFHYFEGILVRLQDI